MRFLYTTKYLRKVVLIIENFVFNIKYKKKLGSRLNIFGFPVISWVQNPNFQLGHNITLISNTYFSRMGINHPVFMIMRQLRCLTANNDNCTLHNNDVDQGFCDDF